VRARFLCAVIPVLLAASVASPGCGYHVRSAVRPIPGGVESLGIPTFRNLTPQYRLEQQMTQAVVKEFAVRTRVPIRASESGVDAVLRGEVRGMSATPVTFGADSFGSAFLVTVQLAVKLVRSRDGAVLWENPDFLFRERYELNRRVVDFFSEENPALERLARELAASLASTVLDR
jgi:hypothetical protein